MICVLKYNFVTFVSWSDDSQIKQFQEVTQTIPTDPCAN